MPTLDTTLKGADANAYVPLENVVDSGSGEVTLVGFKTTADNLGIPLAKPDGTDASDDDLSRALAQGTVMVDSLEPRMNGKRASADQALALPRVGMTRRDGTAVSSESVPKAVRDATCWAASYALANPNDVNTVFSQQLLIKKERVEGVIDVEYQDLEDVSSFKRTLTIVEETLASLLQPSDAEKTASADQRPVGWITTGRT